MITKTEKIDFQELQKLGAAMQQSGYFSDVKSASQALVKIMAGRELGFEAFASMSGVNVIEGKPSIGANLIASAIKKSNKYDYRIIDHDDQKCIVCFYEKIEGKYMKSGESGFTIHDAKKAGLFDKTPKYNPWIKYPKNMLFARALSNGVKWYCPDIFNGAPVYTPEELGKTVDEEGNIIEIKEEKPQLTNEYNAYEIDTSQGEVGINGKSETTLRIQQCNSIDELRLIYKELSPDFRKTYMPDFKEKRLQFEKEETEIFVSSDTNSVQQTVRNVDITKKEDGNYE